MDILALVVGGAIGFFASTAKDWLLENKKQKLRKQEFQRDKLEEIYLLFEKWETNFSSIYLYYIPYYKGDLSDEDISEFLKEQDSLLPGEAQKLKVLINIYFPKLANDYIEVDKARAQVVRFFKNPKKTELKLGDFIKAQEEFEVASKKFKLKIVEQTQEVNL